MFWQLQPSLNLIVFLSHPSVVNMKVIEEVLAAVEDMGVAFLHVNIVAKPITLLT